MRPVQYQATELEKLLKKRTVATMSELKAALGTEADITVFRKLRQLGYLSSYSHRGAFYTLRELAQFDEQGLWSFRSVYFSRYGTLLSTAEAFVQRSEAGFFASELEHVLCVGVKEALLQLLHQSRIRREAIYGLFLYCSADPAVGKQQLLARRLQPSAASLGRSSVEGASVSDELKAAIVLFSSLLDEKQRRVYAGLESLKIGHGGDRQMAELLGIDVGTVARGRRQLVEHDVELERVRKAGGGRKAAEKKRRKSSPPSRH